MRILLLGGEGQLGRALRACPWPAGVTLAAPTRAELDLEQADALERQVAEGDWAAVINAAAITDVDGAEEAVARTWRVNALAPAVLAAATARRGLPLLQISTDFVFAGDRGQPYREEDPVGPLNVYGASKEAGEQAVRTANPRHLILRTAWVFSPYRRNFVKTMLRLRDERPRLQLVADRLGSPTSALDLARAVMALALRLAEEREAPCGTFHLVNRGEASWFGFAQRIFAEAAARGRPAPQVEPVVAAAYPTRALRPADTRLATARLEAAYGLVLRPWEEALEEVLDALLA